MAMKLPLPAEIGGLYFLESGRGAFTQLKGFSIKRWENGAGWLRKACCLMQQGPSSAWPDRAFVEEGQRAWDGPKLISNFRSNGTQSTVAAIEARKDISLEKDMNNFLIDCERDQQCVAGGIVALGKFDALHLGHRELAIQASKIGAPFLLSFAGIAQVLGWESRPPIVAKCDRRRVLSSWASYCGSIAPLEYLIDFSNVRRLSPRQFVQRLSQQLRVGGVVAGSNYRFGYKASGNAEDLVRLCKEYGLSAHIVDFVMDETCRRSQNSPSIAIDSGDVGQVSSTRVRNALAARDMDYVAELLGRKHRIVLMLPDIEFRFKDNVITAPKSSMLNQPPGDGEYSNCSLLLDDFMLGLCAVTINSDSVTIEVNPTDLPDADFVRGGRCIGIEF